MRLAWTTFCKAPEGEGLALDGLDQASDRSRPHTRMLTDGKWKNIYSELRENNPLQSDCDRAYELKVALRRARARTRHIWFKGLEPEAERKRLDAEAVPPFDAFLKQFDAFVDELEGKDGLPQYEQGQVAFALKHFMAARELLKTGESIRQGILKAESILAMQKAQVEIEIGADALDAEPTPRVLTTPAYDKKTGLYVLFGGDHFDYLTNDTWVFDPDERKWFQKHPASAPDPRAHHDIQAAGDGTIRISKGYMYKGAGYVHVGKDVWTYDIEKNTWSTASKMQSFAPDMRSYRGGSLHPSYFLAGPKPNAAEHEKKLADLPVNEWVPMKPPRVRAGHRPWGTKALATDYDLIVDWNGGHSGYCSTTAPHYHLGVNRWELPYPEELPLGMIGASGDAVWGLSFNGHRFIRNHSWAGYHYDRKLKKVLETTSLRHTPPYLSTYDPLLAEWRRFKTPYTGSAPAWSPQGTLDVLFRPGASYLQMDYASMQLKKIKTKGEFLRKSAADWTGIVYDSKRDRLMGITRGGHDGYDGRSIRTVDLKSNTVITLKPENPEAIGDGCKYIREWRYLPDLDLCLICDGIGTRKKIRNKMQWIPGRKMAAYDPQRNRWLILNIKNQPMGHRNRSMYGFSFGCRYDKKRKLLWGFDNYGHVCAMRLDLGARF